LSREKKSDYCSLSSVLLAFDVFVLVLAGFVHNPKPFVELVRIDDFVLIEDLVDFMFMLISEGIGEIVELSSLLTNPAVSCEDGGSGLSL
jgi:hypothetical protein